MRRSTFLPLLILIAILAATAFAQPAIDGRSVPPDGWRSSDLEAPTGRYGAVAMRLQSAALAESTKTGLLNLGWKPVSIQAKGDATLIIVGNLPSAAKAQFVADELKAQKLADAEIVALPRGTQGAAAEIEGPFLQPFLPTPGLAKPYDWEVRGKARLRGILRSLPEYDVEEFQQHMTLVLTGDNDSGFRGAAALAIAKRLMDEHSDPDLTLFLAGKVARNEWTASTPETLQAGEYVADILYGNRRDWRGAWSATEALINHPDRTLQGRVRDRLRRAALLVDLAAGSQTPKPSWGEVRSELRQAWDLLPAGNPKLAAKIELMYMETFAWQGQWDRVEELARTLTERYPDQKAESAVASVFLARSLERRSGIEEALMILDRVIQQDYAPGETLYMGTEALDIREMATKWRNHFAQLQASAAAALQQGDK
ncbi:hypothetical protein KQI84_17330 [bacterium]|nr:hypothetical protein [bacterium]